MSMLAPPEASDATATPMEPQPLPLKKKKKRRYRPRKNKNTKLPLAPPPYGLVPTIYFSTGEFAHAFAARTHYVPWSPDAAGQPRHWATEPAGDGSYPRHWATEPAGDGSYSRRGSWSSTSSQTSPSSFGDFRSEALELVATCNAMFDGRDAAKGCVRFSRDPDEIYIVAAAPGAVQSWDGLGDELLDAWHAAAPFDRKAALAAVLGASL